MKTREILRRALSAIVEARHYGAGDWTELETHIQKRLRRKQKTVVQNTDDVGRENKLLQDQIDCATDILCQVLPKNHRGNLIKHAHLVVAMVKQLKSETEFGIEDFYGEGDAKST